MPPSFGLDYRLLWTCLPLIQGVVVVVVFPACRCAISTAAQCDSIISTSYSLWDFGRLRT